jgi:ABC-2 type transport system ATP-binding protein
VAGDLVSLAVDGDQSAALHVLSGEAFVRDSSAEDGLVRLHVDRGEEALSPILRLLEGAALQLRTISLSKPSLDDVFLRQTGHSLREEAA